MPAKPHRVLLDRMSGYADEAAAYLRRRRRIRRPFARVWRSGGRCSALPPDTPEGAELFRAAAALIDVAGPPRTRRPRAAARTGSRET